MKLFHCLALGWMVIVGAQHQSTPTPSPSPPGDERKKGGETDDTRSDAELLEALGLEDASARKLAQAELVRRGDKNRAALLTLVRDIERPLFARTAALTIMHAFWNDNVQLVSTDMLRDSNPELRRLAVDGLAEHGKPGDRDLHEILVQHLTDEDLTVRRSLYLAIGRLNGPSAADTILNALRFEESDDRGLREGLVRALDLTGKNGVMQLLLLADSGEQDTLKKVVEVYPSLRTRFAADALPTLLRNYHLTPTQKAALLHSYRDYRFTPPLALEGKVVAAWLDESESPVRIAAIHAAQSLRVAAVRPQLSRIVAEAGNPDERAAAASALVVLAFMDLVDSIAHK